jgi:hypothetical protein
MKATSQSVTTFVAAALLGIIASSAPAADAPKEGAPPAKPPTTRPSGGFALKYKPVVKDAPASRGWGAARGQGDDLRVYVLAPADFIGVTSREQPTLYWYISGPTKRMIDIAITPVDDRSAGRFPDPVLSLSLKGVEKPGLMALDLSKLKGPGGKPVGLKPGVMYKWQVEVVASESEGARNPHAECMLKRVDAPPTVKSAATPADSAAAYAEAGIWYDALADLNRAIAANPQDAALRDARRELLRQHKLVEDEQGNIQAQDAK